MPSEKLGLSKKEEAALFSVQETRNIAGVILRAVMVNPQGERWGEFVQTLKPDEQLVAGTAKKLIDAMEGDFESMIVLGRIATYAIDGTGNRIKEIEAGLI